MPFALGADTFDVPSARAIFPGGGTVALAERGAAKAAGRAQADDRPATSVGGPRRAVRRRDAVTASDLGAPELEGLMARVAEARDRQAFALLFDHFAPRLKAFLLQRGSDGATAEEVVQEAMLTVWRKAETFDRRQATVSTWIFTVARNKRIDRLRRERRPTEALDDPALQPEGDDVEGRVGARESAALVRQALQALPPEQAALVRMAYFEDKVHTAIAEETGLPLGTVKSRLRLALQRLRGQMQEDES